MARKIAVINRKGGIGKTTTSLCFAEGLVKKGKRVLLVDLDQQHNSTKQYGAKIEGVATVYDILTNAKADVREAIQHTESLGDIIAGDDWLVKAEEKMSSLDSREYMLKDALDEIDGNYDFIIIDCPPSLGLVVKNVLVAIDEVIVPVLCDGYSVESYQALTAQIDVVRKNKRLNPDLRIAGVLVTQYEPNQKISRSYDERLPRIAEKDGTRVFDQKIRRCVKTREAQIMGMSLFDHAGDRTTAQDYRAFVEEYLAISK